MKIAYEDVKKFHDSTVQTISNARDIIQSYQQQGFDLTLRQLYYQFVSRDLIPNKQNEYNRLGRIVNDARMCGLISWHAIEDRTRGIRRKSHWNSPKEVIESAHNGYNIDMWENQPYYVEVWIEKDALIGVIEDVCRKHDVTYFSCRGYVSQSEMWNAAQRLKRRFEYHDRKPIILHLGDHDPSGIDMTRDINDRLTTFATEGIKIIGNGDDRVTRNLHNFDLEVDVRRIALNMEQIEEYDPPPNPAKVTDSRFEGYQRLHGNESWELDALEPSVIERLIDDEVTSIRDSILWEESEERHQQEKANLKEIADNYDDIIEYLNDK